MSKDFKDLINTVEKETKTNAELEATINSLNEEINRLKVMISEQKTLINDQSGSTTLSSVPGEIDILKDLINSQRQDLIKKDESNEKLHDQIDGLTIKLEKSKDGTFTEQDNDDLIEAQELILAFTEENENLRNQVEELKNQINSINPEASEIEATNQELLEENEEMVNIKRLNFQLMEENGLLRIEVESLKVKLHEQIEEINSDQKIEDLTTDEFTNLKEELSRSQNENQRLNNILLGLDNGNIGQQSENEYASVVFNFPKQFQISLFKRMYSLLDETDKRMVINSLIKDLDNSNNDVKRAVLKILCEIRSEKVYEAFLDLLHDEDWVIRYSVIKALTNFGFDNKDFRGLLKKLTKDMDIDVRELAMKVLGEMS